jgi:hypothetical protein
VIQIKIFLEDMNARLAEGEDMTDGDRARNF